MSEIAVKTRDLMNKWLFRKIKPTLYTAVVKSIKDKTLTTVQLPDGTIIEDVPFLSNQDGKEVGVCEVPIIESEVFLGMLDREQDSLFVVKTSEIEDYKVNIEGKYTFKNKDISFKQILEGLIDQIKDLRTQPQTIVLSAANLATVLTGASSGASVTGTLSITIPSLQISTGKKTRFR